MSRQTKIQFLMSVRTFLDLVQFKNNFPFLDQEDAGFVAKILVKEGEMVPTNAVNNCLF